MGTRHVADFSVTNHGSLFLFTSLSDGCREWITDHVDIPDYMVVGGDSFVVEHRYARDLADGLLENGFHVLE